MAFAQLKTAAQQWLGPDLYGAVVWLYYATIGEVLAEPRLRVTLLASAIAVALVFYLLAIRQAHSVRGFFQFLSRR